MSVIKDNGMKVIIIIMKMVCFALKFQVTRVSQDAASQTCGVHSGAASTLTALVNIAGMLTAVTNQQKLMCRAIWMMWRMWLSTL